MVDTLLGARPDNQGFHREPTDSRSLRWAGRAGLAWAAILIVTNAVNAAVSPAPDADVDEVITHLTNDRTVIALLTVGFVIGTPLVYWFITGIARVLAGAGYRHAGITGLFAFAGVFTMFGITAATRLALVAAVETEAIDASTIWALWKFHDITFGFNGAPLAVALATFGIASALVGLVPRIFRVLAPIGAVLLLTSALLAQPGAEGTEAAIAPGGLGFLTWLAFVIAAAIGLVKLTPTTAQPSANDAQH